MKYRVQNGHLSFKCPGCGNFHTVPVDGTRGWKFDEKEITLTPSILQTRGHFVKDQPQPPNCPMCDSDILDSNGKKFYNCGRCHLVLTKGIINFCPDSTHALAGKAVPMVDME